LQSSGGSSHTSVGTAPCPAGDTTKATADNTDVSDNRVTCALAYGQQQSNSEPILLGNVEVISALYAKQLGATAYTNGETAFVNVAVKNVTDKNQTYHMSNFSLQLPNGQIVALSSLYGSTGGNNITVAKGGRVTQVLVFESINPTAAQAGSGKLVYTPLTSTGYPASVTVVFKSPYTYTD
jgi:hypothetical protein